MKRILLPCIFVSSVLIVGCNGKESQQKPAGNYPVMTIEASDHELKADYAASVKGCQTVEIRPQIEGLLTGIRIREGDAVHKGQVLFEIDPAQFQAAYDVANANVMSAEAAVSTAQLVLDSNNELYQENIISDFEVNTAKNELAAAKAKLALAKAELEKAATNLSYTQVKSPVNGVASMIPYRAGALVSPNISAPLVTVSDDDNVFAYFSLSETQMLDMVGQYGSAKNTISQMPEVEFRMINKELYPIKGHIDAVSGVIDRSTGAISVRAVFPNPDRMLREGSTGTVVIPYDYKDCIVIPQSATYELQEKIFVYKVVDGKATSVEIKVLPQSNGYEYIVTEGLEKGDVIVSEGAGLIKEGTEIISNTDKK